MKERPNGKDAPKIRVLYVDDQEVFRDAFGILLSHEPSIDMVGASSAGQEAIEMIPELNPDVVVMDVMMPGVNGIKAAQYIREAHPQVGIILLSAYDDSEFIRELLKDDPRGKAYLLKHTLGSVDDLVRTIQDVAGGRTVLDPIMVEKLTSQKGISENSPLKELTRREMEVLALMAKACTNSTIASILYIQPRTVEHHINSIFSKLSIAPETGQHARVQAVLAYLKATGQAAQTAPEAW